MPKFKKKPVVVEAVRFTPEHHAAMLQHLEGCLGWQMTADGIQIPTLEGVMVAKRGDWVVKGTEGEFYPCKPAAFDATFEAVQ